MAFQQRVQQEGHGERGEAGLDPQRMLRLTRELQAHRHHCVQREGPQRPHQQQHRRQAEPRRGRRTRGGGLRLRLGDQERRNQREQQHQHGAEVDQHDVPEDRADRVGQHAEAAGHRLHPGVGRRARRAFRGDVGDQRAGRVEADVDRQVQRQRHRDRHAEDRVQPQRAVDQPDRGQRQQRQRGQQAADQNKGPAPPAPQPDAVADDADQDLADDPGQRPGGPDDADLVDVELVLGAEQPAQRGNLHRQREAHRGGRQAQQHQKRQRQPLLHLQHRSVPSQNVAGA